VLARLLSRDGHPVGRNAYDVGALQGGQAEALGKPAIVADVAADPADGRSEHRKSEIARLEEEILLVPQVNLAEGANIAVRSDHHGAVVKEIAVSFRNAGDDVQIMVLCRFGPGLGGRSSRNFLRQPESFLAALEDIARIGEFGQNDQVGAVSCGFVDQRDGAFDIVVLLPNHRFHLNARDLHQRLAAFFPDRHSLPPIRAWAKAIVCFH
jgi:hypothetical protein